MAAIALVGNAPSSGSTLLSDLLDCSDRSASGPELNLFSNLGLYDFASYRLSPWRCSASASVHTARNCIVRSELPAYGLDARGYARLVRECDGLAGFLAAFASRFLALRGKYGDGTVFEKTPQNVNAIGPFLEACPQGWFVSIVRNPVHVFASLLERGFPPWIALISWLVDVAQVLPYRRHPRVLLVRYEDLVREPFRVVAGVLRSACGAQDLCEAAFMDRYGNNAYTRLFSGRVATWSVSGTGTVRDANRRPLDPAVLSRFAAGVGMTVDPAYAGLYGFPPVGYREAVRELGYESEVGELLEGVAPERGALLPDPASLRMLGKKALYALATGAPSRAAAAALLRPVRA